MKARKFIGALVRWFVNESMLALGAELEQHMRETLVLRMTFRNLLLLQITPHVKTYMTEY